MKQRKTIAAIITIVGLVLVGLSYYIQHEVDSGRLQVEGAQSSLKKGKALFSISPVTNEIGEGIERSANRKIDAANREIAFYANLAQILRVGGILVTIFGLVLLFRAWRS